MRKRFDRVRLLAGFLALLFLLIIGASGAVLLWPSLLLNDRTLKWAQGELARRGVTGLSWRQGSLDAISESLLKKRLRLRLDGVCYQAPDVVQVCFDSLEAQVTFDLGKFPPGIGKIGPVRGEGGRFAFQKIPLSGTVGIEGTTPAPLEKVRLAYDARATFSTGRGAGPGRGHEMTRVRGRVSGELGLQSISGMIDAEGQGLIPGGGPGQRPGPVRARKCHFELARAGEGSALKLSCPIEAGVPTGFGPLGLLDLPRKAQAVVSADLKSAAFPPSPSRPISGRIEAKLTPVSTSVFELGGSIGTRVSGIPAELAQGAHVDADIGLQLEVRRFERLAGRLEGTPWALWAPLRNLTGSLSLEASGKVDLSGGRIPLRLQTKLRSPSQKLDLDSKGTLELALGRRGSVRADLDVELDDVELELPRLDLAAPPRLLPDPRVVSLRQKAGVSSEKSAFVYRIRVRTPPGRAARVLSNLAQAPVPLTLDLTAESDQPLKGDIRIQGFPVKFFNHKATIDHFNLTLRQPEQESPIDGEVKLDLVDYQFRVLATGTVGKPGFVFASDPPLSQDQILSVLLFGQPPDQLDAEQSSTVSNANAALSDQAVGLASFLLLGSTPIQGVNYDPTTKQVQVRFKIAKGTSLSVGTSSGDTRDVGVRHRLGKDWSIATDLTTAPGENSILSAFLEWAHRY